MVTFGSNKTWYCTSVWLILLFEAQAWGKSRQSGCFGPPKGSETDKSKAALALRFKVNQIWVYLSQNWSVHSSLYLTTLWTHLCHDPTSSLSACQGASNKGGKERKEKDFDRSIFSYLWNLQPPVSQSALLCSSIFFGFGYAATADEWWIIMEEGCEDAWSVERKSIRILL